MAGRIVGRPFQKGHPGGPGRPKTKTAREAVRAALAQPSTTPGKTRIQEWSDELATERDTKIRMEILRWLEGSSPKESQEPVEDEPTLVPMPGDIVRILVALGWVPPRTSQQEPIAICENSERGTMEPRYNGSSLPASSDNSE